MDPSDLVEIARIERVKYRYLRCLDQKRWEELASCLTDDVTAAYSGGAYTTEGRAALLDFLERTMGAASFHSSHRVHHPEIDLLEEGSAAATWAFDDVVVETSLGITIRGAGFYEDRFVRVDDEWRIAHTGYRRTYEELLPRASIAGLELTASWWSTEGRSRLPAG